MKDARLQDIRKAVQDFHEGEDGMETMQVVMIVAIAAMVVVAIYWFGNEIVKWAKSMFDEMRGGRIESPG